MTSLLSQFVLSRLDATISVPNRGVRDPFDILTEPEPVTAFIELLVTRLKTKKHIKEEPALELVFSELAGMSEENIIDPVPSLGCTIEDERRWVRNALLEDVEDIIVNGI